MLNIGLASDNTELSMVRDLAIASRPMNLESQGILLAFAGMTTLLPLLSRLHFFTKVVVM